MKKRWVEVAECLPPEEVTVLTKIDEPEHGLRNVQKLRRKGRLWFFPDMSMYVYYTPTHWAIDG